MNPQLGAFISAIIFYTFPFFLGWILTHAVTRKTEMSIFAKILFSYTIGGLVLFGATLLFGAIHASSPETLLLARGTLLGVYILTAFYTVCTLPYKALYTKKSIAAGVGLILLSLTSYGLWKHNNPYPLTLNWDIYEHQLLASLMQQGNISFITSRISDTFLFNGYSTIFHTLLAVTQHIIKPDLLGFWWFVEYAHMLLVGIVTYFLSKRISQREDVAWISTIISLFTFETTIVFGAYFLIPQTLAALLWAGGLTVLLSPKETIKNKILTLIPLSVVLILSHYIVGTLGVVFFIEYIFFSYLKFTDNQKIRIAFTGIVLTSITLSLSYLSIAFNAGKINFSEAASPYFTQPIMVKIGYLISWYGLSSTIALFIGLMKRDNAPKLLNQALLFVFLCLMGIVFAQAPYVLKFYALGRYIMPILIAKGYVVIISTLSRVGKIAAWIGIIVIIIIQNIITTSTWKQSFQFESYASQISHDEIEAAAFLAGLYNPRTALIVSDPATSYILESVSGINSQGGAYMNSTSRKSLQTLSILTDGKVIKEEIRKIQDTVDTTSIQTMLFIPSARYMKWQAASPEEKNSITFDIWRPSAFTLRDLMKLQDLSASLDQQPIFSNTSIAIFAIPVQL